jgi:hypothetical protein
MRHPARARSHATRFVIAILCLVCTGAFAAARGVVRVEPADGNGWVAAAPTEHLAPARTPESIGLLRDGRRAEPRSDGRRVGVDGTPHPSRHSVLVALSAAPRSEGWRAASIVPSWNRSPYDATAPPIPS